MAPYTISNFRAGVDTRSPIFASDPGTLYVGRDLHLTPGGQLAVRKAFVKQSTLPAGTFGLFALKQDLWVFGSIATPAPLPTGVFYQRLQHPGLAQMTGLVDVEPFQGKHYAIAQYTSDTVHFYDGVRVADWVVAGEDATDKFIGGSAAKTLGEKVYVCTGSNLNFCKTGDPTLWGTGNTGAGFLDLSTHSAGFDNLTGVDLYYDSLAVFSGDAAQLWHVEADPVNNARVQTVSGMGLVGPRAAVSHPDGDTYFLSRRGVRRISPKDISSGRSKSTPASAPVDKDLRAYIKTLAPSVLAKALLLIEPEDNRLWVLVGERVWVRSWFPDNQIDGWTDYDLGFVADWACVCDNRIWLRSGNDLYLYGGVNDDEYVSAQAVAQLPYLDMRAPANFKNIYGLDAGVVGEWEIWIGGRPGDSALYERVASIRDSTYDQADYPAATVSTHVSVEFRHVGANEAAELVALTLHGNAADAG